MAERFHHYFEPDVEEDERPIRIKEYHSVACRRPDPVKDNYIRLGEGSDSSIDDYLGGGTEYDESHSVKSTTESSYSSSPHSAGAYDARTGSMVPEICTGAEHDETFDVLTSTENSPREDEESEDITDSHDVNSLFYSRHSTNKSANKVDDRINIFRPDVASTLTSNSQNSFRSTSDRSNNTRFSGNYDDYHRQSSSFVVKTPPYNNITRPPAPRDRIVLHDEKYRSDFGASGDATYSRPTSESAPVSSDAIMIDIEEEQYRSFKPGKYHVNNRRQPRDASPILQRFDSPQQTTTPSQFERSDPSTRLGDHCARFNYSSQSTKYNEPNSLEAQTLKPASQTPTLYGSTEAGVSTNNQQSKSTESETTNDKLSKHRKRKKKEETNTIKSEQVEGYKGNEDIDDILAYLGEPYVKDTTVTKQTSKTKTMGKNRKEKPTVTSNKSMETKSLDALKVNNSELDKDSKIQKNNATESHENHVLEFNSGMSNTNKKNPDITHDPISNKHVVPNYVSNGFVYTTIEDSRSTELTKSESKLSNGEILMRTNHSGKSENKNTTVTKPVNHSDVVTETKGIDESSQRTHDTETTRKITSERKPTGKTVNLSPEDFVTDDQLQDVLNSSTLVNDFQKVTKKQKKVRQPFTPNTHSKSQTFSGVTVNESNNRAELVKAPLRNKNINHSLKPVKTADNVTKDELTKDKLASNTSINPHTSVEQTSQLPPNLDNSNSLASRIRKNMAERQGIRKEQYDMSETSFPMLSNPTVTATPQVGENKKSSWARIASKPRDNESVIAGKISEPVTSCNEDAMSQSSHVSSLTTTSSNDESCDVATAAETKVFPPEAESSALVKSVVDHSHTVVEQSQPKPTLANEHPLLKPAATLGPSHARQTTECSPLKPAVEHFTETEQFTQRLHTSAANQPNDAIHIPKHSDYSIPAQPGSVIKMHITSHPPNEISHCKPADNLSDVKTVLSQDSQDALKNFGITFGTNLPQLSNSKSAGLETVAPSTKSRKPIIFKDRYLDSSRGGLSQLTFGSFNDTELNIEPEKEDAVCNTEETTSEPANLKLSDLRDGFEYDYLNYCNPTSQQFDLKKIVKYLNKEWMSAKKSEEKHPEKTVRYSERFISNPT